MSFGVDFDDYCFTGHVLGGARNFGCCCPARSAPGRPEVDQNGDLRVFNDFVEKSWVRRERFCDRGEFGFTSAAAACVG